MIQKVYEPHIRALLGTAAVCASGVLVLGFGVWVEYWGFGRMGVLSFERTADQLGFPGHLWRDDWTALRLESV